MADSNTHSNYTVSDIDRYLNGAMTAAEMHDMERAALQDPFLADAIEGYREADQQQSAIHLNEITAAIQGAKQQTKVIPLPKKKNYAWQIAASVVILVSAGLIFYINKHDENSIAALARNDIKKEERKDSFANESSTMMAPLSQDSSASPAQNADVFLKRKNEAVKKEKNSKKKSEPAPDAMASASLSKAETTTQVSPSRAARGTFDDKVITTQQQSLPATADTQNNSSLAEVVVTKYAARKAKSAAANTWTTDKGKPFLLSEVEVISMGRKQAKPTDTSAIKPEGGWQSFRDYLFSKLSKKDTARFAGAAQFSSNLELEFSLNGAGLPYNITVLHAKDSTTANEVISAMQQGPKWISNDKKEKRLNLKY